MPGLVIVGAQWGDEGKGKIVDLVSETADIVVRYGGGANAGHTLKVRGRKLVTHLLPSGVLHPRALCVLGNGMVLDPTVLLAEFDELNELGLALTGRVVISRHAHVTFPFQAQIDRAANAGPRALGTTGRGIGPTYSDKAARAGLQLGTLFNRPKATEALSALLETWTLKAQSAGVALPTAGELLDALQPALVRLESMVGDASLLVDSALKKGQTVVFEGAQGTLLDLDHGSYPFVTSSSTIAGGACTGTGIGPTRIQKVLGISKAYCTRVGNGPFPTELHGADGEALRQAGSEFGATTGRPRRCGWLDLPGLRYAARVNGLTALAITKLDVLSRYAELPVCVGYEVNGARSAELPVDALEEAKPLYETLPGWQTDLGAIRSFDALPLAAQKYISFLEAQTDLPVEYISVGAEREATILRPSSP